jgi:CheY-like chemotaxis protein
MADPTQIDQILFNLVSNANDAMPEGGMITIETKMAELDNDFILIHGFGEAGRYVLLSVSDTGTGMNKTTIEKVFEPFFTTKETGKGTGLGLSTVYGIVKQHNGYVAIYSEERFGTIFHIYFPLEKTGENRVKTHETGLRRGKGTVLIAEDNRESRLLAKKVLELYGYVVIEAVNGEDAVEKFHMNKAVNLVILDLMLPIKNGKETCEEIVGANPEMKVLFTGNIEHYAGFNEAVNRKRISFIAKPLIPRDVLQKIRQMLNA